MKWRLLNFLSFLAFTFVCAFVLTACSRFTPSQYPITHFQNQEIGVSSEIVQYFLPDLPDWANFSSSGECQRKVSIKYFDLMRLRKSFGLSYESGANFQSLYNKKYNQQREWQKSNKSIDHVPFKEEERIFYETLDETRGGKFLFKVPSYKKVFVVWVDKAINSPEQEAALKTLMESPTMDEAPTVFLSLCLSYQEMDHYLKETQHYERINGFISFEMFSIYEREGNPGTSYSLNFASLFHKDQEIVLYIPKVKKVPPELKGEFKIQSY